MIYILLGVFFFLFLLSVILLFMIANWLKNELHPWAVRINNSEYGTSPGEGQNPPKPPPDGW